MKTNSIITLVALSAFALLGGCQTPPTGNAPATRPQNTLYQTGTFSALQAGHYDGAETAGALKTRGNLGVGTFDTLDGEMVMLDGQIYQIRDSGAAVPAADSLKLAYGLTTNFNPPLTRELSAMPTLDALKAELDKLITHRDLFYAIRVEGTFQSIKLRNLSKQQKPYPLWAAVYDQQSAYEFQNITGTLVGVWSPEYVGSVSVAGYNLHFISADRTQGGHILDGALTNARVSLVEIRSFEMNLSPGD